MCFYVIIAVPADRGDHVPEVFGQGFKTSPTANRSISAALPAGYPARLITNGMCSCDLYASPRSETEADPEDHLRRKYAKLGWSDAKITRAVEQAKAKGSKNLHARGLRSDVVSRLQELCQSAGKVAVLVHWYHGDVETERLSLTRAQPCDCGELPSRATTLREGEVLIAVDRAGIDDARLGGPRKRRRS
jgi:hypothetical protein